MNKKNIRAFVVIFVIIIVIILLFYAVVNSDKSDNSVKENININYRNPKNAPNKYDVYDDVHKKMANKESFLVYFTNKDPYKCYNCNTGDSIIDYYESIYNIKFIYFDTSYTKHLIKLNKEFGLEEGFILPPAVVIFKDGLQEATVSDITVGDDLKEYLLRYNFITSEKFSKDNDLNTDEKFDKVFNSKNNSLIVMYSGLNKDLRVKLYNITNNKVNYYYIFNYNVTYYNYQSTLSNGIGKMVRDTTLVIVNSGKVIDYMEYKKDSNVEKFLKKNKII